MWIDEKIGNPRSYLIHTLLSNDFDMDEMHKVIEFIKNHEMSNRMSFEEKEKFETSIAQKIYKQRGKESIKTKLYEAGIFYLDDNTDTISETIKDKFLRISSEEEWFSRAKEFRGLDFSDEEVRNHLDKIVKPIESGIEDGFIIEVYKNRGN